MNAYNPCTPEVISRLKRIVGPQNVSASPLHKSAYSRDMWPKALIWQRKQPPPYQPDAVVWPQQETQIQQILQLANEEKIPIIPWGAGSGVCGGCIPLQGGIALDMKKLNKVLELNTTNHTACAQAGIIGENFERYLNAKGFTLSHFPSSIYCSTLGGWLATRSAGQLSTKYGKIEDMVLAFHVALPNGHTLKFPEVPRQATGPEFSPLFLGSEGTLGIITQATVQIRSLPESRQFLALCFPSLQEGLEAIRTFIQKGIYPAAVRLYDALDSLIALHKSHSHRQSSPNLPPIAQKILQKTFSFLLSHAPSLATITKNLSPQCLLILTFEGPPKLVDAEYQEVLRCSQPFHPKILPELAKHWWENRYNVSYKQSKIFQAGAFVDTMEVATSWQNVLPLYQKMIHTLSKHAFVMAHFSHVYPSASSIYFTFVGHQPDHEEELYDKIWHTALQTVLQNGGTLSHHHGLGLSKSKFLPQYLGQELFQLLKQIKNHLDPNAIMNPGKLALP